MDIREGQRKSSYCGDDYGGLQSFVFKDARRHRRQKRQRSAASPPPTGVSPRRLLLLAGEGRPRNEPTTFFGSLEGRCLRNFTPVASSRPPCRCRSPCCSRPRLRPALPPPPPQPPVSNTQWLPGPSGKQPYPSVVGDLWFLIAGARSPTLASAILRCDVRTSNCKRLKTKTTRDNSRYRAKRLLSLRHGGSRFKSFVYVHHLAASFLASSFLAKESSVVSHRIIIAMWVKLFGRPTEIVADSHSALVTPQFSRRIGYN